MCRSGEYADYINKRNIKFIMKRSDQFGGFCMAITSMGTVYYYFDDTLISMEDFMNMELQACLKSVQNDEHIFDVLDTNSIGRTYIALN